MTGQVQPCTQPGCDGSFVWGRTHRDPVTGKGGKPCPVDWPFPPDRRKSDGTVLAADNGKVPNVGLRKDQHGTWVARVVTVEEPMRADERPGFMHHVTCKNPPQPRRRAAAPRTRPAVAVGQETLALDLPGSGEAEPGLMSDARLFPRRRSRRG